MIGYLEQHYAEPIQIDHLATTFGYSKNTLYEYIQTTHWDKLYGLSHTNAFREGL